MLLTELRFRTLEALTEVWHSPQKSSLSRHPPNMTQEPRSLVQSLTSFFSTQFRPCEQWFPSHPCSS